jgi:hypothetical protein
MRRELAGHEDRQFVDDLLRGLESGFLTGIENPPTGRLECPNLLSAKRDKEFVDKALAQEVNNGYIIGPLDTVPYTHYRVSPMGVAQSKYSLKKRLILDLSSPHDVNGVDSVNSLIDKDNYSLKYVTIDDAIKIIKCLGKGSWLTKVDIKDAFRILPIHPSHRPYHCVKWKGRYYVYARLAFGSRSSPKIFTELSKALHFIATKNYGIDNLLFLLDDFLAIDSPLTQGNETRNTLVSLCERLGIPLNDKKTEGPTTCLQYLGIELDTCAMEARLPREKMERIKEKLQSVMASKACTKRQLLSLLGHLAFASRVVKAGRAFVSQLIEASCSRKGLHEFVTITDGCREDISVWLELMTVWNGIAIMEEEEVTSPGTLKLFTDSSSSVGFGAYWQDRVEFVADSWLNHPLPVSTTAMSYLELYPVVVSAVVWGHHWRGKRIVLFSDNEGTVAILQKGRSKCSEINKLLRRLMLVCTVGNFSFSARWLSTKENTYADLLSRGSFCQFQTLCPHARQVLCPPQREIIYSAKHLITT